MIQRRDDQKQISLARTIRQTFTGTNSLIRSIPTTASKALQHFVRRRSPSKSQRIRSSPRYSDQPSSQKRKPKSHPTRCAEGIRKKLAIALKARSRPICFPKHIIKMQKIDQVIHVITDNRQTTVETTMWSLNKRTQFNTEVVTPSTMTSTFPQTHSTRSSKSRTRHQPRNDPAIANHPWIDVSQQVISYERSRQEQGFVTEWIHSIVSNTTTP
ncbi:unnamed protein product [Caenorhabditis brenneri]